MSFARLMADLVDAGGDVKRANLDNALDSADVIAAAPKGMTVYSTLDSLPTSSLTAGDQAYVSANNRMYISNGSGWYNVALINLSPTMSLDQSGTIALTAESLTATVTITAQDSDNPEAILTYSVESDGNMLATGTSVSQDSSVFTITAISEDSGAVAGSFDLTFKVSDQINQASEALSFTLTFSNIIDSSAETVLLMKAAGNSVDNSEITHLIGTGSSLTNFVEQNGPEASTFTPYRSGGYSTYFNSGSSTSDYVDIPHDSTLNLTSNDFTIECWIYVNSWTSNDVVAGKWQQGSIAGVNEWLIYYSSGLRFLGSTNGQSSAFNMSFGTPTLNQWNHIAVSRSGNNWYTYLNGTQVATRTGADTIYTSSRKVQLGRYEVDGGLDGYIRDFRIVKGSAVYTSAFTPPTEALTAITNTVLLTCHLPYMADGSTNGHTVTPFGSVSTQPFGPYDYEPWTSSDGGSVNFVSTSNIKTTATAVNSVGNSASSEYTVEGWIYLESYPTTGGALFSKGTSGTTVPGDAIVVGQIRSAGEVYCSLDGNFSTSHITTSSGTCPLKVWTHIALTKTSAGLHTLYVNGVSKGTYSNASVNMSASTNAYIGGIMYDPDAAARTLNGYVADVRVTNEVIYTGAFTPPTSPVSQTSNTTLLMNNESDANLYDATGSYSFSNAGVTSSNTVRKFTTSSSYNFATHYLSAISDDVRRDFTFGQNSEPYTFEFWMRLPDTTQRRFWYGSGGGSANWTTTSGNHIVMMNWTTYAYVQFNSGGSATSLTFSNTDLTNDQWHHIAYTYDGTNHRFFLDGTVKATTTGSVSKVTGGTYVAYWGRSPDNNGTYDNDGYMQDMRITRGVARYTANFTPPTAEFEL